MPLQVNKRKSCAAFHNSHLDCMLDVTRMKCINRYDVRVLNDMQTTQCTNTWTLSTSYEMDVCSASSDTTAKMRDRKNEQSKNHNAR